MRELKQQDVCDMEVDLAEVMCQEADASFWSTLAPELETVVECLPAEEEGVEDIDMPSDERRDESQGRHRWRMKSSVMDQWQLDRVLKHGRASELANQEVRRMHCPRRAIPRHVLDFNERLVWTC